MTNLFSWEFQILKSDCMTCKIIYVFTFALDEKYCLIDLKYNLDLHHNNNHKIKLDLFC